MASSRLPGKSLADIEGSPLLSRMVARLRQSLLLDRIVIATTSEPQDDPIAELADELGLDCFRGSEDDVLGRVLGALDYFDVDLHAEFQGDNPLPDPLLIDAVIGFYLKNQDRFDYVTNALRTTFPPGAEVAVYPAAVLRRAEIYVEDLQLREHVGIHIYQRPDLFRIHNIEAPPWLRAPHVHIEVDTAEDLELVRRVYRHFLPKREVFGLGEILEFVQREGLVELNSSIERRWRSFRNDQ